MPGIYARLPQLKLWRTVAVSNDHPSCLCLLAAVIHTHPSSPSYRIAGYFQGGKFSRISRIGLNSRIFSP